MKVDTDENVCPACGPVPGWATSLYCARHCAALWNCYLALKATKAASR